MKELKELPELRLLLLRATQVTVGGLRELREAKKLKTLVLQGKTFNHDEQAMEAVRKTLPGVDVRNSMPRR